MSIDLYMCKYNPNIVQKFCVNPKNNDTELHNMFHYHPFGYIAAVVRAVFRSIVRNDGEEDALKQTMHFVQYLLSIFVMFKTNDENRCIRKNRYLNVWA